MRPLFLIRMSLIRMLLIPPMAVAACLAGCATPPASAYVGGGGASGPALAIGRNASGEACTQQGAPDGGADVFCGTWEQPSARIRLGPAAAGADLAALATDGQWRNGLNARYDCGPPWPPPCSAARLRSPCSACARSAASASLPWSPR